ncbi:MAG: hypothetical protein QOD53_1798 [Thermoleophilaceae bacterium]|nr:hypothetical protein [Thermoleophilaceae bacterium]
MRRRALPLLTALAALVPATAARADFFAGDPVDGPDAAVQRVGDVDLARDGSGSLVYTKQLGPDTHVYTSRFVNGAFQGPEQIDTGLGGVSSQAVVAVADSGQAAVAFVNGGVLYGATRAADSQAWSAPAAIFASGDPARPISNPSIDMSINGVAYVAFTVGQGPNADVAAARMRDNVWSTIPAALDVDPNQSAGTGASRPRVAVSADNNAVAIWGETGADGANHVFARRLTVLTPSQSPQELNLPDFEGRPGGSADSPDIDINDDNSYGWAVFRQQFSDGGVARARIVARRLVGSQFEAPTLIDGLTWPATENPENPEIDQSGHGEGLAALDQQGAGNAVIAAFIFNDKFQAPVRLDSNGSASPPLPVAALGEVNDGAVAWQSDPGGGAPREIHARSYDGQVPIGRNPGPPATFGPERNISRPELGSTDAASGFASAADRSGDVVIAWVQGAGADKRIVAGFYDKPPSNPYGLTTTNWRNRSKPALTWNESGDWGTVNYLITIDNAPAGTSTDNSFTPTNKLKDGLHTWAVVGTDIRGQQAAGKSRQLRIDTRPPTARIAFHRKKGVARVRVLSAHDTGGSGVSRVRIDFGDGFAVQRRSATHRTKKMVRVSVRDKAGNVLVRKFAPGKKKK